MRIYYEKDERTGRITRVTLLPRTFNEEAMLGTMLRTFAECGSMELFDRSGGNLLGSYDVTESPRASEV